MEKEARKERELEKKLEARNRYNKLKVGGNLEEELLQVWTVLSTPNPDPWHRNSTVDANVSIEPIVIGLTNGDIPIRTFADPLVLKHLLELVEAGLVSGTSVVRYETTGELGPNEEKILKGKIEVEMFKLAQRRLFKEVVRRERVRQYKETTSRRRRFLNFITRKNLP